MICTLTGATGFIGTRLVRLLSDQGHQTRIVSRRGPLTWERIREAVEGAGVVINLAGEPVAQRWNPETKRRIRDSRIQTTRMLVDAIGAAGHRPGVLISASATGYYGERGEEVLTEESSPGQGFLSEICVEWEREAERAVQFGLRVATPRIGIVLGAEGGILKQVLLPFRAGVGGKLGTGRQWMSWIHVEDLVSMIAFAAQTGSVSGAFNATGPCPVRNAEFAAALGHVLHRPAVVPVPTFAVRAMFGEMAGVILASQRVEPQAARNADFGFRFPELQSALASVLSTDS